MERLVEWISQPWPWYVGGPLIALFMVVLLLVGKQFGMSSNLRTLCSIAGAGKKTAFFDFDWKLSTWNLWLLGGAVIGGFIASHFLHKGGVNIHPQLIDLLNSYGIESAGQSYLPAEIFSNHQFFSVKNILIVFVGGFFVGFGARYAGGCTSGHAISGLSNLQWPSLLAVIGFFLGGLITTFFLLPIFLPL